MTRLLAHNPVRLVQITDTHLFRDPSAELLSLNTQHSFECVLELIQAREPVIDAVLATGDIAQDASVEAYHRFISAMQHFDAPCYWIPGNHDRRPVMQTIPAAEKAFQHRIELGNWQIIMLNTAVIGEVHGRLESNELQMLEACLGEVEGLADRNSLICMHHNPVPGSSHWMDGIGLRNAEEFFSLIDRFSSVRGVVYGHIHQALDYTRNGVKYFCTPSTCIQFKQDVSDFTLDERNPAYRWLELQPDGQIESAVVRVTGYRFTVDHSSAGY
ncbi:MAG: 3',5'-cyclic-AMP phosphodiesterase [Pseudomonadales bacterium]|nr:3',5'-cyclic-AMP phosphodiesterase [Pseudomonadales bacterium]